MAIFDEKIEIREFSQCLFSYISSPRRIPRERCQWIPKRCKGVNCVDLGESFLTSIYLQNLASIQPRTSPVKFARSPCTESGALLSFLLQRPNPDHHYQAAPGSRCTWSALIVFGPKLPSTASHVWAYAKRHWPRQTRLCYDLFR